MEFYLRYVNLYFLKCYNTSINIQGLFQARVVSLLNRNGPLYFTLECMTAQFPCQLWYEIYWTDDFNECSFLQFIITAAIAFCIEPLAYHLSALKCNPTFLCNLEHQHQQDIPSVYLALVTVNKRKWKSLVQYKIYFQWNWLRAFSTGW